MRYLARRYSQLQKVDFDSELSFLPSMRQGRVSVLLIFHWQQSWFSFLASVCNVKLQYKISSVVLSNGFYKKLFMILDVGYISST